MRARDDSFLRVLSIDEGTTQSNSAVADINQFAKLVGDLWQII